MDKKGKKQKMKNRNTSIFSGKALHGQKCILANEAIEYLRSLGHLVSNKAFLLTMLVFLIITLGSVSALTTTYLNSTGYSKDITGGTCTALSSAQVYNQTWLNFSYAQNVSLPENLLEDLQQSRTFVFWASRHYPTDTGGIICDYIDPNGNYTCIYLGASNGTTLKVAGNGTLDTKTVQYDSASVLLSDDKWHMVTVVIYQFNSTHVKMDMFGNGSFDSGLITREFVYNTTRQNTFIPRIGQYYDYATTRGLNKTSLDEIRIYDSQLSINDSYELYQESSLGGNLGQGVVIYNFHTVNDTLSFGDSSDINVTIFSQDMAWLNATGMHTITYKQLNDWKNGGTIPQKSVIINFDDWGEDAYLTAKPIMDLYGFVGVFAVTTKKVGDGTTDTYSGKSITWAELLALQNAGWEIIPHGTYHWMASSLSPSNLTSWLVDAKQDIYNNLGTTPVAFVYPYAGANDSSNTECVKYYSFCINATVSSGQIGMFNHKSNINGTGIVRTPIGNSSDFMSRFINTTRIYANLSLYLKFNENSGTTVYDLSGNGNNGTLGDGSSKFLPTWQNDGVLVSLPSTSYTFNSPYFTLTDPLYNWANITLTSGFIGNWLENLTYTDWHPITECVDDTQTIQKVLWEHDKNNCGNYTDTYYYMNATIGCSSPDASYFVLDLESKTTIVILAFLFIFVILFLWLRRYIFAGSILVLIGFMLLFSGFNDIVSIVIICGGILAFFLK